MWKLAMILFIIIGPTLAGLGALVPLSIYGVGTFNALLLVGGAATGAAIAVPLSDALRQAYFIPDSDELSPVATAYTRARGADRLSSFGDFAAVSDTVDVSLAKLLRREVSDAIIAPGYEPEALEILDRKREGYLIIEIDPDYEPGELESREVFGLTFEQKRNDLVTDLDLVVLDQVLNHQRLLNRLRRGRS